jgi:hypothetical protein
MCGQTTIEWQPSDLKRAIDATNGYSQTSKQIVWLRQELDIMSQQQRREFLRFVTGCPALPAGGLAGLSPRFRVIPRLHAAHADVDKSLPSSSTCFHQLKLPRFTSRRALAVQLQTAMLGSAGAIDFS